MSTIAIGVEGLGKKYRLGATTQPYKTMRESLTGMAGMPLRAASRLARRSVAEGGRGHRPEFWALKDVNFEVKHGEVLGIIGRNGAGKSTLLKLLSQITEPTEGRIGINGRVASLLEVGTGFHPELTGRENVYLNGAILGMSRQEVASKFDEIVAFAEVEKFIDTQVKFYSSGMYLRLAFSVAAHLEPEILIVDEVLAVGDAAFQKKCLGKMNDVAGEGRTVLFVSHNLSAMSALCTQGLLLHQGHVMMTGSIATAVKTYKSQGGDAVGHANLLDHPANTSRDIRFEELGVYQQGVGPAGTVTTNADIELRLTYSMLRPMRGIEVSINIALADGQYLLSTSDIDTAINLDSVREPGRYTATCVLPPSFFRGGRYYIDCACSRPNVELLARLQQVVAIDVLDGDGMEIQSAHNRIGILSPRLSWSVASEHGYFQDSNTMSRTSRLVN